MSSVAALLVLIPAAVGGFALAVSGSSKKKGPKGNGGNTGAQDSAYVPYVAYQAGDGRTVYAVRPELVDAVYRAIRNWYTLGQDNGAAGVVTWPLAPRGAGQPENEQLFALVGSYRAAGYSILASPQLAWPSTGSRYLAAVPGSVDPWAYTSPSLAMLAPAAQWASPPGRDVMADPLADLSSALRSTVKHLAETGPLRRMRDVAEQLDADGHPAAAAWLRERERSRRGERAADAKARGYFDYRLRANERPPFMFAEAYLGEGEGGRYGEIVKLTPGLSLSKGGVKGWNAGKTIRIPPTWGDPEDVELPLAMGQHKSGKGAAASGPAASAGGAVSDEERTRERIRQLENPSDPRNAAERLSEIMADPPRASASESLEQWCARKLAGVIAAMPDPESRPDLPKDPWGPDALALDASAGTTPLDEALTAAGFDPGQGLG